MRELGKIPKSKDMSLETKAKIIDILIFPVTMHRCEIWTVKKADRKQVDSFEVWWWRRDLWIPRPPERRIEAGNIAGGKNDGTEAVPLWTHLEKAGFFGKDSNAAKNRRQQEKTNTECETD